MSGDCVRGTPKYPEGRTGTYAGYHAHLRIGEKPCKPCRLANGERSQEWRDDNPGYDATWQEMQRLESVENGCCTVAGCVMELSADFRYCEFHQQAINEAASEYYLENRQQILARVEKYHNQNLAENLPRALEFLGVDYICVECGATDDLHFDHVDPTTKEHNISVLLRYPWSVRIESELRKCQLLCAPCHGRKTNRER